MNSTILYAVAVKTTDKNKYAFDEIVIKECYIAKTTEKLIILDKPYPETKNLKHVAKEKLDHHHDYSRTIFTLDKSKITEYIEILRKVASKVFNDKRDELLTQVEQIEYGLKKLTLS